MLGGALINKKLQSAIGIFLLNILLALIIYYNAELGRLLGLKEQPLAVSVVWPSTGFALAGLLLFGTKVWPGIFLGNFVYNFLALYQNQHLYLAPLATAFIISSGSLLQALVGNYIMRRYCTSGYFHTLKDVLIFLIPAGLLTCLIAATIGTITLYVYSPMSWLSMFYTWLTFWVGDTMGVYIFTPLIVVWSLLKPLITIKQHQWEAFFMLLAFGIISLLTFHGNYPLVHLYIPFSVWVTYRFRMHGATLAIFFITICVIVATSAGFGPFDSLMAYNPLLILVTFLEIIVATCLILAAVVNEREAALVQLRNHNIDLQQAIKMSEEELKERSHESFVKEKIASLGTLTSGMVRRLEIALGRMSVLINISNESLKKLNQGITHLKDKTDPNVQANLQQNIENIGNSLSYISKLQTQLNKVATVIEEQALLTSFGRVKVKSIDINMLLNKCLLEAQKAAEKRLSGFTFAVKEEYDDTIELILLVPMDLAHALFHLMNKCIASLKEKKEKLGNGYTPLLQIQTKNLEDEIQIIIRDNGIGLTQEQLKIMLFSFLEMTSDETSLPEESSDYTYALAYDIITHIYAGQMDVDSVAGEYLQFNVLLPK